jgi:hypothetical protein
MIISTRSPENYHTAGANSSLWLKVGISALPVIAVAAIYSGSVNNQFINLDDYDYVVKNPHVTSELTLANVWWAFTAFHSANWNPLTWLSYMLDV